MPKPFDELRERLLRAGVAPRHVRRYLAELADHLADLTNEELHAGRGRADADSAALVRLGTMEELAQAMISRRDCQSWCARAPWAMFSLAPLFSLAAAYFGAAFYLWCGWNLLLSEADTPFGVHLQPIYGIANLYFQAGKFFYIVAPFLAGWGIAILAARQRLKAIWPITAMLLIAWMGGTAQIQASRSGVSGLVHIRIHCFAFGASGQAVFESLGRILAIFTITALPWVIWRIQMARSSTTAEPSRA